MGSQLKDRCTGVACATSNNMKTVLGILTRASSKSSSAYIVSCWNMLILIIEKLTIVSLTNKN